MPHEIIYAFIGAFAVFVFNRLEKKIDKKKSIPPKPINSSEYEKCMWSEYSIKDIILTINRDNAGKEATTACIVWAVYYAFWIASWIIHENVRFLPYFVYEWYGLPVLLTVLLIFLVLLWLFCIRFVRLTRELMRLRDQYFVVSMQLAEEKLAQTKQQIEERQEVSELLRS